MERIIKIELFDEVFQFKAESSEIESDEIVGFLTSEVENAGLRLGDNNSSSMKFVQLLLASLNICNKHIELQREYEKFQGDISARTLKVIEYIDKNVPD